MAECFCVASFHELILFSYCSLLLSGETKPKNPTVSAIPCCLPLCEVAQLRVMQMELSHVAEVSYLLHIDQEAYHLCLWRICCQQSTCHKKFRVLAFSLATQVLGHFTPAILAPFLLRISFQLCALCTTHFFYFGLLPSR